MAKDLKISSLKRRNSRKRNILVDLIIAILIIAIGVIGYLILSDNISKQKNVKFQSISFESDGVSTKEITLDDLDAYQVAANYPRLIEIPSLGIKTRILPIGLLSPNSDDSQQLDVPKNIYDSGWYDCTINPVVEKRCVSKKLPNDGNTSVANLINAHSCKDYTLKCAFNELENLKEGDIITIELGNHSKINYIVKKVQSLPLNEVDMNAMMNPIIEGEEGLNLITCSGNWTEKDSRGRDTPSKRIEVYSIKE